MIASARLPKFVSRAEHLAWRERWKKRTFVKLAWTPNERAAILRQDELYRQADERWELPRLSAYSQSRNPPTEQLVEVLADRDGADVAERDPFPDAPCL